MRVAELSWCEMAGGGTAPGEGAFVDFVLFFGSHQVLGYDARYYELRAMFPNAHIFACSAGGQIRNDDIVGFYSYAEISSHRLSSVCELYNRTLTGTTIAEAVG